MSETFEKMDSTYRVQRYFYDVTRKYYLLGRDRLLREMNVQPGETVLEVGCGTGRNLIILARRHPDARFFGLDASASMLETAEWKIEGPLDGPGLHSHENGVDSFYVIEGELEMTVEDEQQTAGPGTIASVPPGALHTFNHRGVGTVRFINVHAPDEGFAGYLRSISD